MTSSKASLTQLFVFPRSLSLNQQLEKIRSLLDPTLQSVFGTADFLIVNGDPIEDTLEPLKIEQVRDLQLEVIRSPLQGELRVIVIAQIESASAPAQNSLLKLLEEPPKHVAFLLTTTQLSQVLETIQSRSQVVQLADEQSGEESSLSEQIVHIFEPKSSVSMAEVFKLSEEYKDRPEAKKLFESITRHLHQELEKKPSAELVRWIEKSMKSAQMIDRNVNTRFVIEEFFFQFVPHAGHP